MSAPNLMFDLITRLKQVIFEAEERRLGKERDQFAFENARLEPTAADGFLYGSIYFSTLEPSLRSKGKRGPVSHSLVPALDAHMKDRKQIEFDKVRVSQALAIVLKDCRTAQDIRDTLPNCLTEVFEQTKTLPRLNEEAFTLRDNPRAMKQYQKLKELIEFYMVSRMLY